MTQLYTSTGQQVSVWDAQGNLIWGGPTAPTDPTDPEPPVEFTVRRQITGHVGQSRTSVYASGTTGRTYATTYPVTADGANLVLGFADTATTGRQITVKAGVIIDGVLTLARFDGQDAGTMTGAATATAPMGHLYSDPIPVTVQARTALTVVYWYGPSTTGHPRNQPSKMFEDARTAEGDHVSTGTAALTGTVGSPPRLHTITAMTTEGAVAVAIDGDSISESGSPDDGKGTFLTRAVEHAGHAWGNYGFWANQASPVRDNRLPADLAWFTHVLTEYGFNDLNNAVIHPASRPLDGYVKQRLIQHWQWMTAEGPKVYQTTITPQSTSTDGWTTVEGQTEAQSAEWKRMLNDWIRDGAPIINGAPAPIGDTAAMRAGQDGHPLAGWLEVAHTVESSPNSTIFRVDHGPLAPDGAHPNGVGHELMSAPIRQWAQQITTP